MAKVRSPNYPTMSLGAALKAAESVFKKDNRNKVSRAALGAHLGYKSLSGPALGKIGALRAYGVMEGSGDELKISDDAVTALVAPKNAPDRQAAIGRMAARPSLFQEIASEFPSLPSPENLQFWLVKKHFTREAAKKAAKSYLDTMRLAAGLPEEYDPADDEGSELENPPMTLRTQDKPLGGSHASSILDRPLSSIKSPEVRGSMLQEVFNLDEGPVTLAFPSALSEESFDELKAQLELFLRRQQRRARQRLGEETIRRMKGGNDDEAAN